MNQAERAELLEQIEKWNDADEFSRCIEAIEAIPEQERDYLLYKFNHFQACRYGLEGTLTDVHTGDHHLLSDDTLRLLENVASSADKVGAASAINALRLQVKNGLNEARQMREFVTDGGSLIGLVKKHCEIWAGQ